MAEWTEKKPTEDGYYWVFQYPFPASVTLALVLVTGKTGGRVYELPQESYGYLDTDYPPKYGHQAVGARCWWMRADITEPAPPDAGADNV